MAPELHREILSQGKEMPSPGFTLHCNYRLDVNQGTVSLSLSPWEPSQVRGRTTTATVPQDTSPYALKCLLSESWKSTSADKDVKRAECSGAARWNVK